MHNLSADKHTPLHIVSSRIFPAAVSCSKTLWGVPLLTRIYGSALPRAIAPAVISGLITMILLLLGERVQQLWDNPFAYQPFVLIVSFVLTFR